MDKMNGSTENCRRVFSRELKDEIMKDIPNVEVHINSDEEDVDIMGPTNFLKKDVIGPDCDDLTESSSSFDDTGSGDESLAMWDESEVMSNANGKSSAVESDGFGEKFGERKKKVSRHWRNHIRHITWRCKWAELQIKKLDLLSKKYDRELDNCKKQKKSQLENSISEGGCARTLTFSRKSSGHDILRRKRRRREEETTDMAAYISRHNLFSYYENKRRFGEGGSMGENPAIQVRNMDDEFLSDSEPLLSEPGHADDPFEQTLWKIHLLKAKACDMRSRVGKVSSENAEIFVDSLLQYVPASQSNDSVPNNGAGPYIASDNNGIDGVLVYNQRVKEEPSTLDEIESSRPLFGASRDISGSGVDSDLQ